MIEFKRVDITLNYGTTDTKEKDVICVGQSEGSEYSCIAVTVEEARWLSEKLLEFADKFDE